MSIEQPSEKIEKEVVLEMLKINGFGHAETMTKVIEWTKQQEALVTTSREGILLNISRVDLYLAAGDKDGAFECLEDALTQADQEGEIELQDEIINKLKALR